MNIGVTGGATVDVASIGGALGCYLKATAKTGADVAELLSYGLFRRCRQSNLLPREIENVIWGGGHSGAFGWASAEEWSLGVENRIFAGNEDASVESGAYAGAKAKVALSKIAAVEGELKGTLGTKITDQSLTTRKGGAGKANLKSGKSMALDTSTSRGAQKSVGVGTGGFELAFKGSVGPLEGSTKVAVGWSSDGAHGKKTVTWDTFKISAGYAFTMPSDQLLAGGVGNLIPKLVETLNKIIRTSVAETEAREGARVAGNALDETAGWAGMMAGLANVPSSDWAPFADPAGAAAGTSFSMTTKYTLTVEGDFKKPSLTISLNQVKGGSLAETVADGAGGTTDAFKLDLERTSRLLKVTYSTSGWKVS